MTAIAFTESTLHNVKLSKADQRVTIPQSTDHEPQHLAHRRNVGCDRAAGRTLAPALRGGYQRRSNERHACEETLARIRIPEEHPRRRRTPQRRHESAHESSPGASATLIVVPCCEAPWIVRTAPISCACSRRPASP